MATLLPKNGEIFSYAGTAPSPSKDYCQLVITLNEFVFRTWKISLRNDAYIHPKEERDTHEDFLYNDRMQSEILRVLGKSVLNYAKAVAKGHIDYLPRLPEKILLKIFDHLELEDIENLAEVNTFFNNICNSENTWKSLFQRHTEVQNTDVEMLASKIGWKKVFFTNKLQLQLLLRRQKEDSLNQNEEKQMKNVNEEFEVKSDNIDELHPSYELSSIVMDNTRELPPDERTEAEENYEKIDFSNDSQISNCLTSERSNLDIQTRDILSLSGIEID